MGDGALALAALTLASCNKDPKVDNDLTSQEKALKAAVETYVPNVIYNIYGHLADETESLYQQLSALKEKDTYAQNDIDAICETFLSARKWWEQSEAFLYGAATAYGIDPHIDSWPLDVDAFNNLMNSPNMLAALAGEDGDVVAGEQLGNALLGFHGIEYILFNNGQARDASEVTETQMVYAVAVAGDLRNRCFQLEVSWIGDAAAKTHRDKVEELELNSTVNGGSYSYGDNLKKAGNPGSTYASSVMGLMAIVDGCKTIADEVGTSKIGKCHTGEDVTYVESPYSQKSITDFYDNITSIKNAYMGGMESQRDEALSLHTYIKDNNKELDNKAMNAIGNAMTKIQAMKAPFVQFYADASAGEAMEACQELSDVMAKVKAEFGKIDRK